MLYLICIVFAYGTQKDSCMVIVLNTKYILRDVRRSNGGVFVGVINNSAAETAA